MKKVADVLGVSMDALVYFMRKYDLKRRSVKENEKIKFARKPMSFKLSEKLDESDESLKVAGTMLYWGEGYKSVHAKNVDFANSDVAMIKVFLSFLRKICNINESKLRIYLYCYNNQNPKELLRFWSKATAIPLSKFTKPYIRKDFKKEKINKMKNGLIHVRYYDTKLLLQLLDWIEEFKQKFGRIQ